MFGDLVRGERRRLGLSQEELAEQTGIGVRSIGKIEAGRSVNPRPTTVRKLADAFGLTGDERDRFCSAAVTVLTASPGTTKTTADPAPTVTGRTPAQLPADVTRFTGRKAHLDHLTAALDRAANAVVISAIAGTAGIGKTALAVHWAHRVRHRFPDGQLYVNLRGFHPSGTVMDPAQAIRAMLEALDVPRQRIPASLDAQAALYRSELADRRMLVVIDNARDAEQVRPLLPGAPGCFVVVTSRSQLTSLVAVEGARPLTLDLLTPDEAREMLAGRLGPDRLEADPDAVDEIVTRCARLPLALAIVAARAATNPGFPLRAIAGELRGLDALADEDPSGDIRAVFSWSVATLTPAAARMFRLVGLHAGPEFSAAAAASLAGVTPAAVRPMLAELARAHLIVEAVPGRYTLHDLLRAYAAELAAADDDTAAALTRMFDCYVHTAHAADRLIDPHRDGLDLTDPVEGVSPEPLAGHQQALTWFATEQAVLINAVRHAAATGFDRHAWYLARTLAEYFDRRGHWRDSVEAQHVALEAARRLGDRPKQADSHRVLARAHTRLGEYDDAHVHYGHALDVFARVDDRVGQAHTHNSLADVCERQNRYQDALDHARRALALHRDLGDQPRGVAAALNAVGWYQAQLGDHRPALASCEEALRLLDELGDRYGQAATSDSLGYVHHRLGNHDEALRWYRHSLEVFRDLGDRYWEATLLTRIGETHRAMGAPDAAREEWQHALTILDDLAHPDAEQVRVGLEKLD